MKTFKFRLKNNNQYHLLKMAGSVNFVWNYCNESSLEYLDKHNKWLSAYDLDALTKGCSKDLAINAQTIQAVNSEFSTRRNQLKKRKLSWRSKKRSLGWVPFKSEGISLRGDCIVYNKVSFRFWKSREIEGKIKTGSFVQDTQGRWYVCLVCETPKLPKYKSGGQIGIDLGLKTIATLSDGTELSRDNITVKYERRLMVAQRACKKRAIKSIHAKIKNSRKDWNHKVTTKLINSNDVIFVGNVSPSKLKKTRMAKSVSDAGWADFKSMLAYKAIALGVEYKEVKENFSTVTCSVCFERTGPSGLSALGVRKWVCKQCGASHNRDVNAAKNILSFGLGHQALKGISHPGLRGCQINKPTI
jgi:putative transposase